MTRNTTDAGTAPLRIVTRYQEQDSYLAGALHVRQGWHWHWEALSPTDEPLSSVIKGPFPTEDAALDNAAVELARGKVARQDREALHAELGGSPETLEAIDQAERGPYPFAPGELLYSSWGYDQTNVDFYRVEKRAGDWVTLQKLEAAETSDGADTMTGRAVPLEPHKPIGDPFRRKVHANGNSPFVKLESYAFAYGWDGQPMRVSHYA